MALKRIIDTLDGLKPDVAALYAKGDDGKFRLDVDGIEPAEDVTTLKTALAKEKAAASAYKKRMDEIDAEKAAREEELLKKAGNTDALEKSYKDREAKRKAEYEAAIAERDREIDQFSRGSEIDRLLDGKVIPRAKDWLKKEVLSRTRLEKDANGKRVIRVLDESGNPTATGLEEFIKSNVLDNKDNAPFIIAGRASGGGSGGANAGGGSGAGSGKVITTEAFSKLPFSERRSFIKDGGHIKDQ